MSPRTPTNDNNIYHVPKSKSFSGHLPSSRNQQTDSDSTAHNQPTERTPKSNKRKSGVAKKIERRQESEKKLQLDRKEAERKEVEVNDLQIKYSQPSNQKKMNGDALTRDSTASYLHSDSVVINAKKKSRFKLFKKKKKSLDRPHSPILSNTSDSNLDDTMSIIISNKSDTTGSTILESTKEESTKIKSKFDEISDPLFAIANPEFVEKSPEKLETAEFVRNSLTRRTAPPKLNESEEIVESSSCRRVTATHRQAVVLKTDSPEARSLLRSSLRGSKRSQTAALVKQNLNFRSEDNLSNSPKPSKVQIGKAFSQQALVTPLFNEAHVISKTVYSPKPKRAQKVKLENVETLNESMSVNVSEERVMQKKKCSPMPQRSKKLRLAQKGVNPLLMSSSSESDTPPARPELPKNIDLLLSKGNVDKNDSNALRSFNNRQSLRNNQSISSSDDMKTEESSSAAENNFMVVIENNTSSNNGLANGIKEGDKYKVNMLSDSMNHASKDAKSVQSSNYRTFMYAKKDQERLSGVSSVYRTPDSDRNDQSFFTPNTTFTPNSSFTESKHSVRIPAKRRSDSAEGAAKRYSSDIDENLIHKSVPGIDKPTNDITSSVSLDKKTLKPEISEANCNKVVDESATAATISNIIARYRKTPETKATTFDSSKDSDKECKKGSESPREKAKRSISQRSTTSSGGDRSKKHASSQNKARVMSNISSSFDKIVNKYYPKKVVDKDTGTYVRQTSVPSHLSAADKRRLSKTTAVNRQLSTPSTDTAKQTRSVSRDAGKLTKTAPRDPAKQNDTKPCEVSNQPSRKSRDMTKLLLDNNKSDSKITPDGTKSPCSPLGIKTNQIISPSRGGSKPITSTRDPKVQSCDPNKRRGSQDRDVIKDTITHAKPPRTPSGDLAIIRSPLRDRKKSDPIQNGVTKPPGSPLSDRDATEVKLRDNDGTETRSRDPKRYSASYYREEVKHHPSTASRFYRTSSSSSDTSSPNKTINGTPPIRGTGGGGVSRRHSDITTRPSDVNRQSSGDDVIKKSTSDVTRYRYSSGSSTISRDSFSGKPGFRSSVTINTTANGPKTPEKYVLNHHSKSQPQSPMSPLAAPPKEPRRPSSNHGTPAKSSSSLNHTLAHENKKPQKPRSPKAANRNESSRERKYLSRDSNRLSHDTNGSPARDVSPDKHVPKEDLPASLWNKKDYSRYLQSLRYSSRYQLSAIILLIIPENLFIHKIVNVK